ncbi:MAG: phytanoyl-CoA dioxygenase family protein [Phormidesmis sp.]
MPSPDMFSSETRSPSLEANPSPNLDFEPAPVTAEQIQQFRRDGFLVIENLFSPEQVEKLLQRFDALYAGEFETGIYPDEWHWNPHLGLPAVAGQMTGVWRCDRTLAAMVMSEKAGQIAAMLEGWSGTRLLTDGLWQKPPSAKETTLHQDSMYINAHQPVGETTTCWVALSNAFPGASTIEYVPGSHTWPRSNAVAEFHNKDKSYLSQMEAAAQQAGAEKPEVVQMKLSPGSCVFHHGNIWHGSGQNMMDVIRRSLVIIHVPAESTFQEAGAFIPGGYIAAKYRRHGDNTMDESFFPIVWQEDGYRTPFLNTEFERL